MPTPLAEPKPARLLALWGPWAALSVAFVAGAALTQHCHDTGDSLLHYFYARHAPAHPENLLNHWAKPLYTLLAQPWAQAGWRGVVLLNALLGVASVGLCVALARQARLQWPGAVAVAAFLAPQFIRVHYSGLTEPLFAFVLVLAAWLGARGWWAWAAAAVGLLPFVRSEGMIYQLLLAGILVALGRWRALPWLGLGYALYGLVGWLAMGWQPWWYFAQNPYDGSHTATYGTGTWTYYLEKLPYVLGIPLAGLFALGVMVCAARAWATRRQWRTAPWLLAHVWVLGGALAMLGAHTVFWAVGGFNSFGMVRVLVGVLPLMALVAHAGGAWLLLRLPAGRAQGLAAALLVGYVLAFPFLPNPAALKLPADFAPHPDVALAQRLRQPPMQPGQRLMMSNGATPFVWDIDIFDTTRVVPLSAGLGGLRPGDVLVWDDWFGPIEGNLTPEALAQAAPRLQLLQHEQAPPPHSRTMRIYRVR